MYLVVLFIWLLLLLLLLLHSYLTSLLKFYQEKKKETLQVWEQVSPHQLPRILSLLSQPPTVVTSQCWEQFKLLFLALVQDPKSWIEILANTNTNFWNKNRAWIYLFWISLFSNVTTDLHPLPPPPTPPPPPPKKTTKRRGQNTKVVDICQHWSRKFTIIMEARESSRRNLLSF